jgi:DNA-binding transcriptional MerR regulator
MEKIFYTISEVSSKYEEPQHVLRFWEREFELLKPMQSSNRRYYRQEDLKILSTIQKLLREDLFTIEGAKKKLIEIYGK